MLVVQLKITMIKNRIRIKSGISY